MNYTAILYSLSDNVLTITLNRPDRYNAVNRQMKTELLDALKQAERDEAVRCIVLRGAGEKAFCAGQDLKEYSDAHSSMKEMLEREYNPIITSLRAIEKPIIAMINGVAAGAGFSFALACDLRLMAENATLIQAFVRIGLVADSGSHWFLPRLVGTARAFEYAATGREIGAAEAVQVGLVNKAIPAADLERETMKLAASLAQGPTRAIGIIKRTLNRSLSLPLQELLSYEAMMQEYAASTDDHREGVAAFFEKRPPQFRGK